MNRLLLLALVAAPAAAQNFTVTGGAKEAARTVVTVRVPEAADRGGFITVASMGGPAGSHSFPAQYAAKHGSDRDLVFVAPTLKAGEKLDLAVVLIKRSEAPPVFHFKAIEGRQVDLHHGDRPVLRFMNTAHDTTTKDTHELTFKPFHHIFDPLDGKTILTNGAGLAADKSLLFPHHRGLFYAFNRINTGDKAESDTWHGRNGEFTAFDSMKETDAGEVFGSHTAKLSWHGRDGKTFAIEERKLTAYNTPGGTLIDFESTLATDRPKVKLDGDPQHAGFHFRAAMEVAQKTKAQSYYVRPDGTGKPGETRNWDPKSKKGPVDLPWDALSFVLGQQRYTVLRIVHPENPKPSRGSERDYGRFGDYFEYELTPTKPLTVKYRVWVQRGELTVAECEALAAGYTQPVSATVK
jgi:hypothetical protein